MKKILSLIGVLFCLIPLLTLTACKGDNETNFIDTFNEKMLSKFKNPSSVKFIGAWATCDNSIVSFKISAENGFGGSGTEMYTLVVKDIPDTSKYATEFMTSSSFSNYFSSTSLKRGDYVGRDTVGLTPVISLKNPQLTIYYLGASGEENCDVSYNVGKLNKALKNYVSSQGW